MSSGNLFDDLLDQEQQDKLQQNLKPIWAIDLDKKENSEDILKWLKTEIHDLKQTDFERIFEIRENRALYKGLKLPEKVQFNKARSEHPPFVRSRQKHLKVNHLFDLTEQKVSRLVKFKARVTVDPMNPEEFGDRTKAKMNTKLWEHISLQERFEKKLEQVVRAAFVDGEGFILSCWDKHKGEQRKDQAQAQALLGEGEKLTLLDEDGRPQKDEQGNVIKVDNVVRVGDVHLKLVTADNIFWQRQHDFRDVEYIFIEELIDTHQLRLEYPEFANKIKASKDIKVLDTTTQEELSIKNKTRVYAFYHKNTVGLPMGRFIHFTDQTLLENIDLPFSHGELPIERMPDIEVPGESHAQSFYKNAKRIQESSDKLTSMILRNQALCSHPKWFVPRGSVKLESLGNDITIVQYQGTSPPVLAQQNPTPAEVFRFRQELKEDMQQISGVSGVSRGEPPPGIKAGVALQFLNEQENERANSNVANFNEFVRRVARKALMTASDFYEPDDQRTLKVLGKNDEWMGQIAFEPDNLSGEGDKGFADIFDVRIENSSALGTSKAQQIQNIFDLSERFPEAVSQEQVIDLIGIGNSNKFLTAASSAIQTAEKENELILQDGQKIPPEEWEYHIEHWNIHVQAIQEPQFRKFISKANQKTMLDHIMAHEMQMIDIGNKNPAFQEKLLTLKQFPLLFTPQSAPSVQEIAQSQELPPAPLPGQPGVLPDEALNQPLNVPPLQVEGDEQLQPPPAPLRPGGQ